MQPGDDIRRLDPESGMARHRDELAFLLREQGLDRPAGLAGEQTVHLGSGHAVVDDHGRRDVGIRDVRPTPTGRTGRRESRCRRGP